MLINESWAGLGQKEAGSVPALRPISWNLPQRLLSFQHLGSSVAEQGMCGKESGEGADWLCTDAPAHAGAKRSRLQAPACG